MAWFTSESQSKTPTSRLICFPYAGASAYAFRGWAKALPPSVEVCAIQLPGRGSRMREAAFTRMPALVSVLAQELNPLLDKPFALFGHSLGAIIAFEFARRVRRDIHQSPSHLFVGAASAPDLPRRLPPMHNLSDDKFIELLRELHGTPVEVLDNEELMLLMLPILRADFELLQTYSYQAEPPLACPITAFGGVTDPTVGQDQLKAWESHTSAPFALTLLPGNHFFIETARMHLLRMIASQLQSVPSK